MSNLFAEIGKRSLWLHTNEGGVLERGVWVMRSNWYFEGVLGTVDGELDKLVHPLFFGDVEEICRIEGDDEDGEDWSPLMQCIRGGIWKMISVNAVVYRTI